MKALLILMLVVLAQSVKGQNIPIEKVKDHIGDTVTICSKVYGTKIITNEKRDTLTLINLGAAILINCLRL